MNWIFNLQKSILKLIFAGYTGYTGKNPVRNRLKIQLVMLDFSNLIYQKSSTDGGVKRSQKNLKMTLLVFQAVEVVGGPGLQRKN
jgi:hypothetical protein